MPYLLDASISAKSNDTRARDINGGIVRYPGATDYQATLQELWDGGAGTVESGTSFSRYGMSGTIISQTTRKRYGWRVGGSSVLDYWIVESNTVVGFDSAPSAPLVGAGA